MIKELSEVESEIKWANQKSIMFQAEIIKLTIDSRNTGNVEDIEKRLSALEKKIETGDIKVSGGKGGGITSDKISSPARIAPSPVKREVKKPKNEASLSQVKSLDYWPKVINNLKNNGKPQLFAMLANTKAVELNDMQIGVVGLSSMGESLVKDPDNNEKIRAAILAETGKDMAVKIEQVNNVVNRTKETNFDIPINIIDE